MGEEVKFTDGRISSKTGFQGNISTYQTTTPLQPGNSGGPLFDFSGNLIGINSSGLSKEVTDNVSYSIKSNSLLNLFDGLPDIEIPSNYIMLANLSMGCVYEIIELMQIWIDSKKIGKKNSSK